MTKPATATDVTIIVPAYNEARRIADTIAEIRAYFLHGGLSCQIIVAADGNDGTRERVRDLAVSDPLLSAIGHTSRGGKGRAIREAMSLATGAIVGFVDADQKTPIDEFHKVRAAFDAGYDIVIGSRGLENSIIDRPQPWFRQIGSRGFAIFMHAIVGLPDIVDTQCGFKFFKGEVGRALFARQRIDGYMFDVEILHLARLAGCRIAQVGVRWRDDGDSRLSLVAGNLQNVRDIFRIRFARRKGGRADLPDPRKARAAVPGP